MPMRVPDLLRSVRHTFQSSRLRVALTLLGVMIGAGAMVLLAGLLTAGEERLMRLAQNANESDMIELYGADVPRKDRQKTTKPLSTWDAQTLQQSELLNGAVVNAAARRQAVFQALYYGAQVQTTAVDSAMESYQTTSVRQKSLVRECDSST